MKRGWLVLLGLCSAALAQADSRRSGYEDMSPAIQALQRDDAQNPAMLWVKDGEQRFAAQCAACHTPAAMRGAAAQHPAFDRRLGKPVTLNGRINTCRQRELKLPASEVPCQARATNCWGWKATSAGCRAASPSHHRPTCALPKAAGAASSCGSNGSASWTFPVPSVTTATPAAVWPAA